MEEQSYQHCWVTGGKNSLDVKWFLKISEKESCKIVMLGNRAGRYSTPRCGRLLLKRRNHAEGEAQRGKIAYTRTRTSNTNVSEEGKKQARNSPPQSFPRDEGEWAVPRKCAPQQRAHEKGKKVFLVCFSVRCSMPSPSNNRPRLSAGRSLPPAPQTSWPCDHGTCEQPVCSWHASWRRGRWGPRR